MVGSPVRKDIASTVQIDGVAAAAMAQRALIGDPTPEVC
jgi:hypothetical protein